jgi:acetyltransferase-like isoleucine patch superfamily enzyme
LRVAPPKAGSVVGASSLVTSKFPEACAIAGTPAKVLRERISWTRQPAAATAEFVH